MKCPRRMTIGLLLGLASVFVVAMTQFLFQSVRINHWLMSTARDNYEQFREITATRINLVYYLWCDNKSFEFTNYLSITSAIKHLVPDKIVLFYKDYPVVDKMFYNVWLDEVLQKYPFLETVKVPDDVCRRINSSKQDFLRTYFKSVKGIQWNEHVILTAQPRKSDVLRIIENGTNFLAGCSSASSLNNDTSLPLCVVLDRPLYPKDTWKLNTPFVRSIRKLFYGVDEILGPLPSYHQLVPKIAHVMWFGGGKMDFLFYLSILSLVYVAEVEKVFIHGEAPTGYYWSLLQTNEKVLFIPHAPIQMIYGKPVKSLVHMSDILRVEILNRYGGIYLDTDAIVVKPFDREILAYDAVVSLDALPSFYPPFPDVINNGVMIGRKDAKFWSIFQDSMKNFKDKDYTYNGCRRSYQILERHPELIRVDPHLQVACYKFKCHPTWWSGFRNSSLHHLSSKITYDWRNDAHVLHWTTPTPHEFLNPKILLNSTGMFAEIGKFVLQKSNMSRYFEIEAKTRLNWER